MIRLSYICKFSLVAVTSLSLQAQKDSISPASFNRETTEKQQLRFKKLNDNIFALGAIRINSKTKEITFPATAEVAEKPEALDQQVVEYVLVAPKGKIHESLFITDIKPSHLNVAFKLLGYLESKELFRVVNENFQPQEDYENATPQQKKKSRFVITVQWVNPKDQSSVISYPIDRLIQHASTNASMPAGPWVYGGSFIHKGQFIADVTHDLFAIFTDRASIGNYAGKGREDDTLWFPNSKLMPPQGTKVTFVITPFQNKN